LLPDLTRLLLTYPQDPSIFASLSTKLLRPVPFTQTLTLASEGDLILALQSPAPSVNILAIAIIEKASKKSSDTAILSMMKGLVEQLLRTWLSTPHVEVGEKATQALSDLLAVDCDKIGQGLLWKRIFQDRETYGLLFSLCSLETTGTDEGELDERQKSLAQGRLLRVLPRLAVLDFHAISHTAFPDVEERYSLHDGEHGLLFFAGLHMVDKEDMLMHITLIDFYAELLNELSVTEPTFPTMQLLASLLEKAVRSDTTMAKSLEAMATAETSSPELVELLRNLSRYTLVLR